jgi:hypothetical protein
MKDQNMGILVSEVATLVTLLNKHKTWIEWEGYVAYTEKTNIFIATLKWSCAGGSHLWMVPLISEQK